MGDVRYPDFEFLETDTETILSNMIALYEEIQKDAGRDNYQVRPASPERLFISWMAAVVVQQRILINEIAKMNVPRYAAKSENEVSGFIYRSRNNSQPSFRLAQGFPLMA